MGKYLDDSGLSYFWGKIKDYVADYVAQHGGGGGRQATYYTTCGTTASTAAKVVTISGYTPAAGDIIGILFTTANTAATPTINLNSTGAKSIYVGNATPTSTTNVLKWSSNTMVYLMFDGSAYRFVGMQTTAGNVQGGSTWYGTSSTAATTAAKTSAITNFKLTAGAVVNIQFSTANTYVNGAITLNVNSTGAKTIYVNGAATSASNTFFWGVGEMLTFVYSGSYWYLVSKSASSVRPIVLYNDATGTTGDVTLSQTAANFEHMRIYYRKSNGQNQCSSADVYSPNGKYANLTVFEPYASDQLAWFASKTVYINGTTVSVYDYANGVIYSSPAGGNSNEVAIYRVEAW